MQNNSEKWFLVIMPSPTENELKVGYLNCWYSCLTEATKVAGVDPVDCLHLVKDSMPYAQKPHLASVFYTQNAVPGFKGSGGLGNNQLLRAQPTGDKSAGKRSPRLWPKRHAHVTPINGPAPPPGEWTEPTEDFSKMHEDFGKEVRQLMAEWRKRGQSLPEGDLIDLS